MSRPIRVLSYQCSGVAWAPWRVARLLDESTVARVTTAAPTHGLESYGLPEVDLVDGDFARLAASGEYDVVHLHHAYVAANMIPSIRRAAPRTKIVVTLHGEPDRGIGGACPDDAKPDLYHVVEPGLLSLCRNSPARFVPNHPFTIEPEQPIGPRFTTMLIPYSHVAQFKDHARIPDVSRAELDRPIPHARLMMMIVRSSSCWVQMQGYFDLLTMECWSLGTVPVVKRPHPELFEQWCEVLGFEPACPFDGVADIEATLATTATTESIATNLDGMQNHWNRDRARRAYEALYQEAVA